MKVIINDKNKELSAGTTVAKLVANLYPEAKGGIAVAINDNIVRKAMMNEVLTGDGYSMEYLRELCSQEHLTNKSERIGF